MNWLMIVHSEINENNLWIFKLDTTTVAFDVFHKLIPYDLHIGTVYHMS